MLKHFKALIRALQSHMDNWWYGPALALMACVDLFVVIIPTDALLVSAALLRPRKWIYFAFVVSLGSAIGAFLLAAVLRTHGLPLLLWIAPDITNSHAWKWTVELMVNWGDWTVFLIALSPIMQHPAIALAAFAGMSLWKIAILVFAGRAIKYFFFAWLSTHAPNMLGKLWIVDKELKEFEMLPDKKEK